MSLEKKIAEETSGLSADGLTRIAVSLWVEKKGEGGTIPQQDKELPHKAMPQEKFSATLHITRQCRICNHNKLTGRQKKT